jgi:hypothetical protein
MNKEHLFPQWLIDRTRTTGVKLGDQDISPRSLKLPICVECNSDFNRHLEVPAKRILADLDEGRGISNNDAELFIRWLWKFEGLSWRMSFPEGDYTRYTTLRERVLRPIGDLRKRLVLAVSRVERIADGLTDQPMGLDSINRLNTIFVSGVFCRVAFMVLVEPFEKAVPAPLFSLFHLGPSGQSEADARLLHPKTGFATCIEAVVWMRANSPILAKWHDSAVAASSAERANE